MSVDLVLVVGAVIVGLSYFAVRSNRKQRELDNGTEFHGYQEVEDRCSAKFYFATPYHSWERGSNENTNGLIRQYLPKGCSMVRLTQARCDEIADTLNNRPRKRHGFRTPAQVFYGT